MSEAEISFPPIIDKAHISPHPSRLLSSISVGKTCKGQMFQVPPITDRNAKDRLYYLWFFDNKLVKSQGIIEPDFRYNAIISLNVDSQFLMSHFESRIPPDLYTKSHFIEFFVSDVPYEIPETRYIKISAENEKDHSDYAYWTVTFSEAC